MTDTIHAQDPLPVIVLGTGGITQKAYYPLLSQWEDVHICGIYSRTKEHMQAACARWNIPYGSTKIEEILKLGAKAAFLLTNKESHFELAKMLLENGLDVYLEKPFTETSRQALELANRADAVVVIGGRNSANTTRLAQLCREVQPRTFHIEDVNELVPEWFEDATTVAITAGASTPPEQLDAASAWLKGLG